MKLTPYKPLGTMRVRRRGLTLVFIMDATVISALIAGVTAIIANIISNIILSKKQTALLEYRLEQLEQSLSDIKQLPERVTVLETQMSSVMDAVKELRV